MQPPAPAAVADTTNGLNTNLGEIISKIESIPDMAFYVAIAIGLTLYIVGWFGGIRDNRWQATISTLVAMLIGFFGLPVPAFLIKVMAPFLGVTFTLGFVYLLWTLLIVLIGISLYETWVVTAKEQFFNRS